MGGISQKTKYAVRALLRLAREHGNPPLLIADLAKQEGIPRKFLELILLELKNHGILRSKRGKSGGYGLSRTPDSITIGQIVRLMEGPLAPLPCASESAFRRCDDCSDVATCGTRLIMRDVRDATAK